ncbi:MAG: hypothetical protein EBW55_07520 [Betaproteobacteria bacterium]|nr:hypothetical protein [Betaproteobacteria bacterium]NCV70537.1 hypothetical protein [Betaproteobacteria bacterium]NCW18942.1 hypothetical protein [Betaproteobacteria bacterium]NCW99185.1 hypothetical protein [Betaproteobacteria bacterium]NCZ28136.1 hypothetical protein [Betaproteobacteria bacterium]
MTNNSAMQKKARRARISFQHASTLAPEKRINASVITQVHGDSEEAVLEALKKTYPHWNDFVVVRVEWLT